MTAASTARPERTGLPLIIVDCTGCGLSFPSAARQRTTCPNCRRNLRVHRAARQRSASRKASSRETVAPRPKLTVIPDPARPVAHAPIPRPSVRQPAAFPPITAAPVRQPPAGSAGSPQTAAEALAALGWELGQASADRCQIRDRDGPCPGESRHNIIDTGRTWVCGPHYQALCRVLSGKTVPVQRQPRAEPVPAFIRRMTGSR